MNTLNLISQTKFIITCKLLTSQKSKVIYALDEKFDNWHVVHANLIQGSLPKLDYMLQA